MNLVRILSDSERWQWFAAGETDAAPLPRADAAGANGPQRAAFEVGLVFAVPLALAAAAGVLLLGA